VGGKYAGRGEIDGSTPSQDLTRKGSRAKGFILYFICYGEEKKAIAIFQGRDLYKI
jgi:hypothetical protein